MANDLDAAGGGAADRRKAFYDRMALNSFAPLWEVLSTLVTPEPRPAAKPHLWRWQDIRAAMAEAGTLLTAEQAERRVLVLENPAFPGQSRATATLFAGVQLVLPGEVARAHRHTQSALRFVLESEGGYTNVGGERTTMQVGDFVITPSWAFHDHGNETDAPALWLDVLDLPIVSFFDGSFAQPHSGERQNIGRPEGDALARFGGGMLPIVPQSPYGMTTPIFSYPYERARESLLALARGADPDPHRGYGLRYANPLDGGWALPTISTWITYLPAGFTTGRSRSTDGLIVAVAEGRGSVRVGDQVMRFGPKDVFVVPNWHWRSVSAEDDCVLFCCSDRVAQEKLGLWREETAREETGA